MGNHPLAKTTAIQQRIVSRERTFWYSDGSQSLIDNSDTFFYSANRGSYLDDNFLFYDTYGYNHYFYPVENLLFGIMCKMDSDTQNHYELNQLKSRKITKYNSNNQPLTSVVQNLELNNFVSVDSVTYHYNSQGNLEEVDFRYFDSYYNWTTYSLYKCVYNLSGQLVSDTTYNIGIPNVATTYTYDAAGRVIEKLCSEPSAPTWSVTHRYTYSYTISGKIQFGLLEEYIPSVNRWKESYQDSIFYNSSDVAYLEIIKSGSQPFYSSVWYVEKLLDPITNLPDSEFVYSHELDGTRDLIGLNIYTFNNDGNLLKIKYYSGLTAQGPNTIETITYSHEYYDDTPLSATTFPKESNYIVFPNPVNNELHIISNTQSKALTIKIFNITGQLLFEQHQRNKGKISVSLANLPSSNYFLQLSDGNSTETHLFTKQ